MIPATKYKEKLPRHLSYPVGFDLLDGAFSEVPQADELSISFHVHASRATETEQRRRNGEYCRVLTAEFHHWQLGCSESKDMAEQGYYDPTWSILVYAVSREHRAVARELLCERGIPTVVAWLRTPRSETWLQGRKEIHVYFREKDPSILVQEASAR